jgi:hypothetical protein
MKLLRLKTGLVFMKQTKLHDIIIIKFTFIADRGGSRDRCRNLQISYL